jgi:Rps23 Pro-64 3,4-dihydroxylase Tpa1-like proline 4-hydroxylase
MKRAKTVSRGRPPATPFRAPLAIVDGFLPIELAEAMRRDIDAHFAEPQAHRPDTHQVWNYWYVPELYTYLRTSPEKVIRREHIDAFMQKLQGWSLAILGLGNVTWPNLSLYVGGCRQSWHNDAVNGRFAFVFSLTRDLRRTVGGETLVMREGDPFRSNLARPMAGRGLYDVVEPQFNRLVVFDDRLPHAVERVEGAMDPVEGRFALHGHMSETAVLVAGALSADVVAEPLAAALQAFTAEASARIALYRGPLTLRLTIDRIGSVAKCDVLLDRVVHLDPGHVEWELLRGRLVERLHKLQFPSAEGETVLIQPILFGGVLPQHQQPAPR